VCVCMRGSYACVCVRVCLCAREMKQASLCISTFACLTLFRDVIICLMTMRSARTRTLVTEERSKRAAFTIPVLSLNTVTSPSDWGGKAGPTSVSWAMASPTRQERKVLLGATTAQADKLCLCLGMFSLLLFHFHKLSLTADTEY